MAFLLPLAPYAGYGASAVGGFLVACAYHAFAGTGAAVAGASSSSDSGFCVGAESKQVAGDDGERSQTVGGQRAFDNNANDVVIVDAPIGAIVWNDVPEAPALPAPLLQSIQNGVALRPARNLRNARSASLWLTPHEQVLKQMMTQPTPLKPTTLARTTNDSAETCHGDGCLGGQPNSLLEFQRMRGRLRPVVAKVHSE